MRWGGVHPVPGLLGQIGWAFEYNDRPGRFQSFYCGSTDYAGIGPQGPRRVFWSEKRGTLPELVKAMSGGGTEHPGFDEVKVFEVADSQSEAALKVVHQLSGTPEDVLNRTDPLEHTREILARYGVQSITQTRGFNAPFLWYNMLPGKSVPIRKLAVHLFQLRAAQAAEEALTPGEIEDRSRKVAQSEPQVRNVGECVVARAGGRFVIGLSIAVSSSMTVSEGRSIAERVEQGIRGGSSTISNVFVRVEAFEGFE
jgi:hypothetical protein